MSELTPSGAEKSNILVAKPTGEAMPHPLDAKWYANVDDETYGPFSGHDLKVMVAEGRLEYDSLVRKVGGPDDWIRASDDRALARFFLAAPRAEVPRPTSVSTGDGAQIVTVNNTIAVPMGYLGERPVDKSPFVAAILSLLIVGVGQMYNGEVGKGFLMLIGCLLLWAAMMGWIINIWSIIDAYVVASRKKDAYVRWMEANAAMARERAVY